VGIWNSRARVDRQRGPKPKKNLFQPLIKPSSITFASTKKSSSEKILLIGLRFIFSGRRPVFLQGGDK